MFLSDKGKLANAWEEKHNCTCYPFILIYTMLKCSMFSLHICHCTSTCISLTRRPCFSFCRSLMDLYWWSPIMGQFFMSPQLSRTISASIRLVKSSKKSLLDSTHAFLPLCDLTAGHYFNTFMHWILLFVCIFAFHSRISSTKVFMS